MRFLIAIGGKEYSEPTLRVGMQVASAFNASTTIAYVGEKISEFTVNSVRLAQQSMEKWELDQPGVEVLEWAFNFLADNKYIAPKSIKAGFQKNTLIDTDSSRHQLFLSGTFCEDLEMILRRGDIIPELRAEVGDHKYDVTIIGGSGKRRMAHDLVQYIDSSIFVVKQFDIKKKYKLLLPVDDSKGTLNAIKYGIMVAKAFKMEVDVLTVSKRDQFGKGYSGAHNRALKRIENSGIKVHSHLLVGDPVKKIVDLAGDNHIVVMGVSHKNPLYKFFIGSKPMSVLETCNCPILIVK
jgi:nucleotide-binding universal stress UspA family protein